MAPNKIIISNGFSKFHLSVAAAEMFRRERIAALFTGVYPVCSFRKVVTLAGLENNRKISRLLARGENIADELVVPMWLPEMIQVFGQAVASTQKFHKMGQLIDLRAYHLYSRSAKHLISRYAEAKIYHFRCCFGGPSIARAKALGMLTVCDHSIANPQIVEYLATHKGAYPTEPAVVSPFWLNGLRDLEQADYILVNSEFVKETFVRLGWDAEKIRVLHLGVDNKFFENIQPRQNDFSGPLRLLFAGAFNERKGAFELIEALQRVETISWILEIAGPIDAGIGKRFSSFFRDPRVRLLGNLARSELAEKMSRAEVFVFPSLAEGSARVVFEALACGCFVVTTVNSGSIVENSRHGILVPPGDSKALSSALTQAWGDRIALASIGAANAELIKRQYLQSDYGRNLADFYDQIIDTHKAA